MLQRSRSSFTRAAPPLLLAVAVAALVLSDGSLAHVHGLDHPGLHNQEHDLGYLTTLTTTGAVPDTPGVVRLAPVMLLDIVPMAPRSAAASQHRADFRAPPVR